MNTRTQTPPSRDETPENYRCPGTPENALALLIVLYASALLFGFAEVLRDNAAQTILPSIVEAEQLEAANGRMWGAEMVMNSFIGPPLGGVLIAVGFSIPFFVDAGTFGVAAVLIAAIGGLRLRSTRPPPQRKGFREELTEGSSSGS